MLVCGESCSLVKVELNCGSCHGIGSIGTVEVESWSSEGTAMVVGAISAPAAEGSGSLEMCCITAEVG